MKRKIKSIALAGAVFLGATALNAADTAEPYGKGVSDWEVYGNFSGINKSEKTVATEFLLGIGVYDSFSTYLRFGSGSDRYLNESSAERSMGFGLFKNVFNTTHFDFDLSLDVETMAAPCYTPAFELNLDSADDQSGIGLYLQGSESIEGSDDDKRFYTSALTSGVYISIKEGVQLFAQYDFSYDHDAKKYSQGAAALGLNILITERTELISEFALDIPDDGEKYSGGVTLGFVSSL